MAKARLRLLVDTSLGRSLEATVRESGHDVVFVRDIDPRLPDSAILDIAVQDNRLVMTMDKDSANSSTVSVADTAAYYS